MPKTVPGRAMSQAEIDQRWREARRHLDAVEALLVPGIRTTRWWVHCIQFLRKSGSDAARIPLTGPLVGLFEAYVIASPSCMATIGPRRCTRQMTASGKCCGCARLAKDEDMTPRSDAEAPLRE
jgi:hypothetical protein